LKEIEQEIIANIVWYRLHNTYRAFEGLIGEGMLYSDIVEHSVIEIYDWQRRMSNENKNHPMWNSAYIVSSQPFNKNSFVRDKLGQTTQMLQYIWRNIDAMRLLIDECTSVEGIRDIITLVPTLGPFIVGQIMLDMSYFGLLRTKHTNYDNNNFVIVGPGSEAWMKMVYGKMSMQSMEDKIHELQETQLDYWNLLAEKYGMEFLPIADHRPGLTGVELHGVPGMLCLMDIQHITCEHRKYMQWESKLGRRRNFQPYSGVESVYLS
jgi:hypothetical protein